MSVQVFAVIFWVFTPYSGFYFSDISEENIFSYVGMFVGILTKSDVRKGERESRIHKMFLFRASAKGGCENNVACSQ
jgi:hypothetical protein